MCIRDRAMGSMAWRLEAVVAVVTEVLWDRGSWRRVAPAQAEAGKRH